VYNLYQVPATYEQCSFFIQVVQFYSVSTFKCLNTYIYSTFDISEVRTWYGIGTKDGERPPNSLLVHCTGSITRAATTKRGRRIGEELPGVCRAEKPASCRYHTCWVIYPYSTREREPVTTIFVLLLGVVSFRCRRSPWQEEDSFGIAKS
jgi:hypothetical protein